MFYMAKKTLVTITDDIDGSEDAQTITFGFAGREYEIDLSEKNAAKLEKALKPYLEAGRRISPTSRKPGRSAAASSTFDLTAVREWATANGIPVAARGRVAATVLEQYAAAN